MKTNKILFGLILFGMLFAQNEPPPVPPEFPGWLVGLLAVVLPFLYQKLIGQFSGIIKSIASTLLTYVISIILGLIFRAPLHNVMQAFPWILVCMNLIYHIVYKPYIFKK